MTKKVHTANGGPLNLRASTSTSSELLGTIPNGTKLEVEKINDTWFKTSYNNKEGYVMGKYLVDANASVSKEDLKRIYDSLSETLKLINEVLK